MTPEDWMKILAAAAATLGLRELGALAVKSWLKTREARAAALVDVEVEDKKSEITGRHDLVQLAQQQSKDSFDRVIKLLDEASARARSADERVTTIAAELADMRRNYGQTVADLAAARDVIVTQQAEIVAANAKTVRSDELRVKAEVQVVEMRRLMAQAENDREHRAAAHRS